MKSACLLLLGVIGLFGPAAEARGSVESCPDTYEEGVDYPGNDLKAIAKVADYNDCCTHCYQTSGCDGFTWTDYNGGTCWLKSALGNRTPKAGAVSGAVRSGALDPGTCGAEVVGIDYVGNDLKSVPGTDQKVCCFACWMTKGCKGYTWTNYNGGTCWLKSKLDRVKFNSNARSAMVLNRFEPIPVEEDIDYLGNDLSSWTSSDWQKCPQFCWRFSACKGWTWTDFNGGTCWLKSSLENRTRLAGAVSAWQPNHQGDAPVSPPVTWNNCTRLEENVDFFGNDLSGVPASTFDKCCTECAWASGCKGWTWTNFNGGTCWLKTKMDQEAKKTILGAVSGYNRAL